MSIKSVLQVSSSINCDRDLGHIFRHAIGEMEELDAELGGSDGEDGINGEAVDVIICMLDILRQNNLEKSIEEVETLVGGLLVSKSNKWMKVYNE